MRKLFRDVLGVAVRAGLVGLDHLAVDGTKIEADAGKSSVRSKVINRDQYEDHRRRLRERMATEVGRESYRRRKYTVEPRFGEIKHVLGVRRFMRRGLEAVRTEWSCVCTAVNIGILLRHWREVIPVL